MSAYDHLERDDLIRLLQRRDAERQLGLVWERDEIEADRALNDDYVALGLDPALSHGEAPWKNLIIEGDNYDALRARRIARHRLNLKLDHAEVWSALQLLHGKPLSPWPGGGFAADGDVAYLADFREASVARLRDWLAAAHVDAAITVYSWAPERLRASVPAAIRLLPIPQHLRDRFGRG